MNAGIRGAATLSVGVIACALALFPLASWAQSTTTAPTSAEIQGLIDAHNTQIAELDKEIAQYQVQLDAVGTKKKSLQNDLNELNLLLKKSAASIASTKSKISSTQLQIKQLAQGIAVKQSSIDIDAAGLAESFRQMNESDETSLAVQVLASDDIADTWREMDSYQTLQGAINEQIAKLAEEKQSLAEVKKKTEEKRAELLAQQNTLVAQQGSLNAQKKAQSDLLAQTKSQESAYQAILAQKIAGKTAFEAALNDLKEQYLQNVDPSQILTARRGILKWPLDKIRLTQTFGQSDFAKSGAYNGKGHNGIDMGAPIGTPVKAALSGTVWATGNTDLYKGCYSAGKWIMIKHLNGLSTLYGHLSQISVVQGQSVATGQIIGNVGATGYATGPHLHLSVYVTAVTKILTFGEATKRTSACSRATIPITPPAGFLNPMAYLP
ncbi:peptidoglycan DD-metalloendopeptidase family protein [Candidatus Kaiserbacteria bacterium]|nr:peptidoglycan DD-metalloendopeptidase family protein [Candidatus Kaiserbacteria bacterium]